MRQTSIVLVFFATMGGTSIPAQTPATTGPERGTLILDGGGAEGVVRGAMRSRLADARAVHDTATKRSAVIHKFVQLAGGSRARIVVIPTAWDDEHSTPEKLEQLRVSVQEIMGVDRVTIMHTRDRRQADAPEFVAPLKRATGVWIDGGRDANLWDTYVRTRVETEVKALLARGGVVAGTSAGAVIESSLGLDWTIVDSPGGKTLRVDGTHICWGLLTNSTILPHWRQRDRPNLTPAVVTHPGGVLGIAIDEEAAAVVQGNRLEVIGDGHAGIYDGKVHGDKPYYYLSPGDRFDLHTRRLFR
jgi:cyanophycinase